MHLDRRKPSAALRRRFPSTCRRARLVDCVPADPHIGRPSVRPDVQRLATIYTDPGINPSAPQSAMLARLPHSKMLHSTKFLAVLALAAPAVAQVGWTQRQPVTHPSARYNPSMTYDSTRGVTVLFGGGFSSVSYFNDTWEWNGVNWTQRFTPLSPPARLAHAFAADAGRARVVLFGGYDGSDRNDTWEFDGNNWMQMQTANQPSLRRGAKMEYDAARGRILLFGGQAGTTTSFVNLNDTWEWNGVVWSMRSPTTSPSPRAGHGMTYDVARARIVVFGGSPGLFLPPMTDTWTWDGADWTQVQAAATPTTSASFGFANHTARDLVVRFGGTPWVNPTSETWLFDHIVWRQDSRTPTPPARQACALAHDFVRGRTVLFGGLGTAFLDDTWEYDPGTVARWTPFGSGCAGTSGVPTLRPIGASMPIVGTTFQLELLGIPGSAAAVASGFSNTQWTGGTLPFDLGALGMTGCTLQASPDFMFFAPVTSGRATLPWVLPNDPGLIGVNFFNQAFVLDPGINPTGATVSNAGTGTIGPF